MVNKISVRVLLIFILSAIVLWGIFYAERITVGNGAGWDGSLYAKLCENFMVDFKEKNIDNYLFQRILPFAIIHYLVEIFNLPDNVQTYNLLMSIINGLSILFSAFIFFLISNHHRFKPKIEIIAFSSLFLNYPILKLMGYYPLLTDYLAFSFGLLSYYLYIKKNSGAIVSVSVIFAFIWPTALIQGLFLALLQRDDLLRKSSTNERYSKICNAIKIIIFVFPLLIYFILGSSHIFLHKFQISLQREVTNNHLIFISFIVTIFYMYAFLKSTLYRINLIDFFKNKGVFRFLIIILIYGIISIFISLHSNNHSRNSIHNLLFEIAAESLQAPFSNIINLFAYYGFAFVLLFIYWKKISDIILKNGIGYLLIICITFVFSIGNESRYVINFLPFILFPIFIILNIEDKWSYKLSYIYLGLSLMLSRFWFSINKQGVLEWDRYMLSQGPWQPFKYYLMFFILFILSYLLLFIHSKKIKNEK